MIIPKHHLPSAAITLIVLSFLSSCTTVKQNGYYQTKRYKTGASYGTLFKKHKLNRIHSEKTDQEQNTQSANDETIEITSSNNRILNVPQYIGSTYSTSNSEKTNELTNGGSDINQRQMVFKPLYDTKKKIKPTELKSLGNSRSQKIMNHRVEMENTEPQVHWAAIVGLTTGILAWFIAGLLLGICAIVFSAIALSNINNDPNRYKGKGMAIAGLVSGILAILILALFVGMLLATV